MARLPRLVVPGHAHYLIQRGHGARAVFVDAQDRQDFLDVLREAAAAQQVELHAWALLDREVQLLATPAEAGALGRMVQSLGRRYVSAYNRRHHCTGTLWDGRFRCAVIEPGAMRLAALRLIDGQASEAGLTSASLRSGQGGGLVDPPEVWALGNTPFEREAGYRRLLEEGLAPGLADALRRAALGGWAVGSPDFAAHMAQASDRPTLPRARGRPRRALG